ncbi:MAG: NADH-quinone oxidoreductase subunit I [Candidatus Obscuribacterales bacterium]|jgi:NADH-quinone oxidoreductase subunit I
MANLISRAFGGLNEVRRGLATVFKHTWREPITKNYPDEMPNIAPHFRGRLALTVNPETGDHLCISCRQCERVCPDKCIEITSHKSPETNKLELIDFKIDHGLCMFCGLCTEVCPTLCIINTNDFEMADYSRQSLIYDLKKLTLSQEESAFYFERKEMPLPKPKPAKPAPAAAAAKPAVDAAKPAAEAKIETKPAEAKAEAAPAETKSEAKAEVKAEDKPAEAKAEDKPAEKAEEKPADSKSEE